MCKNVVVVRNTENFNNDNEMSINNIRNWISKPRSG